MMGSTAVPRNFTFSQDKILLNVWISVGAAAASGALCLFVLVAAGWIYSKKLLLWSIVFEVFYDIAFIAVGVESAIPGASESACATGVYFMMSTLGVVNYLCTCIALNLMLKVCFKVNPIEQRLERWYVGVSVALGMFVPIIPGALGHFGYDPILNVCWIQAKTDSERMKYFILDLYLWQILSCVVATLAVIATLIALFRQRRRSRQQALAHGDITAMTLDIDTEDQTGETDVFNHLQHKFLQMAMLISLYPITLILVNGIITIGDLYISAQGGVRNNSTYGLYCIYYFLYGGRGIFFACLGIFVDPCFRRGLRAAWNRPHAADHFQEMIKPSDKASLLDFLDAPTESLGNKTPMSSHFDQTLDATDRKRQGSKASLEMVAALSRLPLEVPGFPANLGARPARLAMRNDYSRNFSGVPTQALPEGLTDDVDVNRRLPIAQSATDPYQDWVGRAVQSAAEDLEPLDPDLPDAAEQRLRERKAQQFEKEEAIRAYRETQTQL